MKNSLHHYLLAGLTLHRRKGARLFDQPYPFKCESEQYKIEEQSLRADARGTLYLILKDTPVPADLLGYRFQEEHLSIEPESNEEHPEPFHYTVRYSNKEELLTVRIFYDKTARFTKHHVIKTRNTEPSAPPEYITLEPEQLSNIIKNSDRYNAFLCGLIKEKAEKIEKEISDIETTANEFEQILNSLYHQNQERRNQNFQAQLPRLKQKIAAMTTKIEVLHTQYNHKVPDIYFELSTFLEYYEDFFARPETEMPESSSGSESSSAATEEAVSTREETPKKGKASNPSSKKKTNAETRELDETPHNNLTSKINKLLTDIRNKNKIAQEFSQAIVEGNIHTITNLHPRVSAMRPILHDITILFDLMLHTSEVSQNHIEIARFLFENEPEQYSIVLSGLLRSTHSLESGKLLVGPLFLTFLNLNTAFFDMLLQHGANPNKEKLILKDSSTTKSFKLFPAIEAFCLSVNFDSVIALHFINSLKEHNAKMPSHPEDIRIHARTTIVISEEGIRTHRASPSTKSREYAKSKKRTHYATSAFLDALKHYDSREEFLFSLFIASSMRNKRRISSSSRSRNSDFSEAENNLIAIGAALTTLDLDTNIKLLSYFLSNIKDIITVNFYHRYLNEYARFFCVNSPEAEEAIGKESYRITSVFTSDRNASASALLKLSFCFNCTENVVLFNFLSASLKFLEEQFLALSLTKQQEIIDLNVDGVAPYMKVFLISLMPHLELRDYINLIHYSNLSEDSLLKNFVYTLITLCPIEIQNACREAPAYTSLKETASHQAASLHSEFDKALSELARQMTNITPRDIKFSFDQLKELMRIIILLDIERGRSELKIKLIVFLRRHVNTSLPVETFKHLRYGFLHLAASFQIRELADHFESRLLPGENENDLKRILTATLVAFFQNHGNNLKTVGEIPSLKGST